MHSRNFSILLVVSMGLCAALPASAGTYTITATNLTMPESGTGVSHFTVTNIPVTGTITLSCGYMGSLELGNLPVCPLTPPHTYSVTAGGTLTGEVDFYPPWAAVPAAQSELGIVLGALALLLLGVRRRGARWISLACLAMASFWMATTIAACAGPSMHMPKGTFPYDITAVNSPAAGQGPSYEAHTTILVTIR